MKKRFTVIGITSYGETKDFEYINFIAKDTTQPEPTYYEIECGMSEGDDWHNGVWRCRKYKRDHNCLSGIEHIPYDLTQLENEDEEPDFYSASDHGDDYYPSYHVSINDYCFRDIDTMMSDLLIYIENGDLKRVNMVIENTAPEVFELIKNKDPEYITKLPAYVQLLLI